MSKKTLCFLAAIALFASAAAADPARIWAINEEGLSVEEAHKPRRAIALAGWFWANRPWACAPAIAIGPGGEAIVTSNVLPVLWRIDPESLAVTVHRLELDTDNDKDVGFTGLVYSERNGAWFAVSEAHGTLWRIDPLLRRAQKVALSEPMSASCTPDKLARTGGSK